MNDSLDDAEEHPISIDGNWWVLHEQGRTIAENSILKVHTEAPISFNYLGDRVTDTQNWFFTFELQPLDDSTKKKAVLQSIYTVDDDEGLQTLSVNSGVMVPEGLLDVILDRDEVGEIGRPPRIPGRESSD